MKTSRRAPKNIDDYIAGHPNEVQELLEKIRVTIRKAAPGAKEIISYQMPAFHLKGNLVYFAAFKKHIGFYPTASEVEKFKKPLAAYDGSKGTVRFPYDQPVPFGLITKIVQFRVRENLSKAALKKKR